jgi:mRNA-degrading endonuclease RelE of RelBE toxin-antitoxin system
MQNLKPPITVDFADKAQKALHKMDACDNLEIVSGLDRFAQTLRPSPKPLSGRLAGFWRIRIGGWRVVFRLKKQYGANHNNRKAR